MGPGIGEGKMGEKTKLDGGSERKIAAAIASGQQPWHTPVIDIVPLKNAETNQAQAGDTGNLAC